MWNCNRINDKKENKTYVQNKEFGGNAQMKNLTHMNKLEVKLKKMQIKIYINNKRSYKIPPYKSSKHTTWSPAFKRWVSETVAANPDAKHNAKKNKVVQ